MIVAGQLSDCYGAAQRLLQGSSVNVSRQLSECCSSVNVAWHLNEYCRAAQ